MDCIFNNVSLYLKYKNKPLENDLLQYLITNLSKNNFQLCCEFLKKFLFFNGEILTKNETQKEFMNGLRLKLIKDYKQLVE